MAGLTDQRSETHLDRSHPFQQDVAFDTRLQQSTDEEQLLPLMSFSPMTIPTLTAAVQDSGLQCEDCDRVFETKAKYNRHRNHHTRPYKCQETGCHMAFASRKDLERHNNSKHGSTSNSERFFCPVNDCSFHRHASRGGFGRKDHLLRHIRRAHSAENGPGEQLSQIPHLIHENLDQEMIDDGEPSQGGDGIRLDNDATMTMEWETTTHSSDGIPSARGIYGDVGIGGNTGRSTVQPTDLPLLANQPKSYDNRYSNVLHRDQYTVGWICALDIEMTAASMMLDELHDSPPQDLNDTSDYIFGRIGSHNIVIASSPVGYNYTSSVAQVASQMLSTFPALRFGLLVGVGSGVPINAPNMQFGDVVVSQPDRNSGGLVQYGVGQRGLDTKIIRTGSLDAPPQVLATALEVLRLNHQKSVNKFTAYLDRICSVDPAFQNPGKDMPILSKIVRAHSDRNHNEGHNTTGLEHLDSQEREQVIIHYGTIASGSRHVRDSVTGQQLADDLGDVLCFETESAGLINTFPCVVIRGICDYIDSDNTDVFQAYAAATAAAYAKELLNVIPVRDVAKNTSHAGGTQLNGIVLDGPVNFLAMSGPNRDLGSKTLQEPENLAQKQTDSHESLNNLLVRMPEHVDLSRDQLAIFQEIEPHIFSDRQTQNCLHDLRTTDPRDDKKRIEDTKGGLLEGSYRWILENSDFQQWRNDQRSRLLWIKGDPGKGKTMLLCGITNELKRSMAKSVLLSYFFCQATDSRINYATAVLRGLIYLLVDQQPSLISHIRAKYDQAGKTLFEDANAWVALSEIFTNILRDPRLESTYLIIDALDECVVDLPKLLDFIVQRSSISTRVKWIVSSRNWPDIEERLEAAGHKVRLCLELNQRSVSAAVSTYIEYKTRQLAERKKYDDMTRAAVQQHLISNSNDTFLWVALVCANLKNVPRWKTLAKLNEFPPGLDSLYRRMMSQICNSDDVDLCKQILAITSIVYRPITLTEITSFVKTLESMADDHESLVVIIGLCGSFLALRETTVYFVHQSAKDFLLKEASNDIFPSGTNDIHRIIFSRSLQVMSSTLRRDIYNLRAPGISIDQVKPPDPNPLAAARYSCLYWIEHLLDCMTKGNTMNDLKDGGSVYSFFCQSFLYWLEALSLMRNLSDGILMIRKLENWLQADESPDLLAFVHDAKRFALYNRSIIEQAPLQAYCSALVFAPEKSIVRETFEGCIPSWIQRKPRVETHWSAMLQVLEGHTSSVTSVAFSPDGKQIVSGSWDRTVRRWDAATGQQLLPPLEGHNNGVSSVAFSPDSKQVVSGSGDKTVRLFRSPSHLTASRSFLGLTTRRCGSGTPRQARRCRRSRATRAPSVRSPSHLMVSRSCLGLATRRCGSGTPRQARRCRRSRATRARSIRSPSHLTASYFQLYACQVSG
ncbi:NACHT domain-containing protein [Leptodontidium sp. MPI-SDFR-AT-0119]|nr:NACHT domain-containing protein [Leptodontidium sp. MPI-SDFR-AT-0119]